MTESGWVCERWDENTEFPQYEDVDEFLGDDSLSQAENHCRSPKGHSHPWCLVDEPEYGDWWGWCDIPDCVGRSGNEEDNMSHM